MEPADLELANDSEAEFVLAKVVVVLVSDLD